MNFAAANTSSPSPPPRSSRSMTSSAPATCWRRQSAWTHRSTAGRAAPSRGAALRAGRGAASLPPPPARADARRGISHAHGLADGRSQSAPRDPRGVPSRLRARDRRGPRRGESTSCSLSGSGRTPKKKRIPRRDPGTVAGRGGARLNLSVREALLLAGEFSDMLAAVSPPKRDESPVWAEGDD